MVGWFASELFSKMRFGRIVSGISAGVVLSILLVCSRIQVSYWQNDVALFGHAVKLTKNNYIMHLNLGDALAARGRLDEAIAEFKKNTRCSF